MLKKIKDHCNDEGWELMCGPCDTNTKKANAGVGVLVHKEAGVKVTKGKIRTEEFQIAHDEERAAKYHVDADWDTDAVYYVIYGQAGGKQERQGEDAGDNAGL